MSFPGESDVFNLVHETTNKTRAIMLLKKVLHTFSRVDIYYNHFRTFNISAEDSLSDDMYIDYPITIFTFSFDEIIDILSSEVYIGDVKMCRWGCKGLYDEKNREHLRVFFKWLSHTQTLKSFGLPLIPRGGSEKSFGLFEAIIANSSIETLSLGNSYVDPIEVGTLISSNTTLTNLDLACCGLFDITPIAQALSTNSRIVSLDLRFNRIEDIDSLSKALMINTTLKELFLYDNLFDNLGSLELALLHNTTLEYISLGSTTDDPLVTMSHVQSHQVAIELRIANNQKRNRTLFGLMIDVLNL